jgi:hypothetical protein
MRITAKIHQPPAPPPQEPAREACIAAPPEPDPPVHGRDPTTPAEAAPAPLTDAAAGSRRRGPKRPRIPCRILEPFGDGRIAPLPEDR